jgi:hypothetical protein
MPLEETFMAEEFLSGAKDMWAVMKEEGGEVLPLQEIMKLFQFTWNLAIMEEDERVSTLEAVPSDFRQFVLDSIENFTKQVSENSPKPFIVHFGLFEDNGEHRLILLFEP